MKVNNIKNLNIQVYENENLIYHGKVEEADDNIKNLTYTKVNFSGKELVLYV